MDKSIALQQQVRENSQSLQNEFFDLKYWEEEMKKADKELKNGNPGQDEVIIFPFFVTKKFVTNVSITKRQIP